MTMMTSTRPYLIRAIYDWIVDNSCTPLVLVNAKVAGVIVPTRHVVEGRIVLNIAPRAVKNFIIGDAELQFDARFSGVSMSISVPIQAVMSIHAQENGQGMAFSDDEFVAPGDGTPEPPTPPLAGGPGSGKKSMLRIVK